MERLRNETGPIHLVSEPTSPPQHVVEVGEGEFVFRQGDIGTEMFIIQEGQVDILQESAERTTRLAGLGKGDFFGEMSLLDDRPRSASAKALSDVKLVRVDGPRFARILRQDPEISIRIMRKLAARLRETDDLVQALMTPGAAARETSAVEVQAPVIVTWGLQHRDSGTRFEFTDDGDFDVGRNDPVTGIQPRIDLSPVDPERSSSRRHAKIVYRDGEFFVSEDLGTTNGTFVNDERLEAGTPVVLEAGDRVRFGLVELEFFVE